MARTPHADSRPYLVIGAGIAGLLAATSLTRAGQRVIVVDKSRGPGGRMATRRIGKGIFDHGAQFFTVRDPAFGALVKSWQEDGLVDIWASGFATPSGEASLDGHPRYRGRTGMTAVPKALAQDLDVRLGTLVSAITRHNAGWEIHFQSGEKLLARGVLLTPPAPQAMALLQAGAVKLPKAIIADLRALTFDPCIALLALTRKASEIPRPGGIQFQEGPIRWIADNHQKGISPGGFATTIHASPAFSQAYWEQEDEMTARALLAEAASWIKADIAESQIHRWRYSQPRETYPDRCLPVPGATPLIFAGDAFGGPKIEGAARSGLRAARLLLEW